jgi:hypothetical protein
MPLRVRNNVGWGVKHPDSKPSRLKMMLYQACNVRLVFQQKYGLAQPNCLSPAATFDFLGF